MKRDYCFYQVFDYGDDHDTTRKLSASGVNLCPVDTSCAIPRISDQEPQFYNNNNTINNNNSFIVVHYCTIDRSPFP